MNVSVFRRLLVGIALLASSLASAQTLATGTIEGRVTNARIGETLERARITIEGTTLEAFTDSSGQYRIGNVPAGAVKLKVFFTGQVSQTDTVLVKAGETIVHDFNLTAGSVRPATDGSVVRLEKFVVETSKEMDAA